MLLSFYHTLLSIVPYWFFVWILNYFTISSNYIPQGDRFLEVYFYDPCLIREPHIIDQYNIILKTI